ncbi:M6 family metalloprotease-like protein/predicted secreted protein (Por secretion system target) [Breznakibacter xylanolyticus]|uniref:M6 family metalloprotease-like protein/predicted secreted protein (Por secretion system target) n=1 Tax=Breznakibacter xylanolyticus TaxID=990 RepID=A0A2W7PA76_9BACT|nr:M6 family metalloprotease domain-containing protein [Breznakibacter xylanolyticus]PZX20252.1 M6 family metalloprotease-like protein/predicted secreted protein (Por secretion system target) [Breznakibacter xylanolyticus]
MWRVVVLCMFVLGWGADGWSIGASPIAVKVTQPDGSVLTVRNHGDERFRWVATDDGYRVLRNDAGVFEYAMLTDEGLVVPSGIRAAEPGNRSADEAAWVRNLPKHLAVASGLKSASNTSYMPMKSASATPQGTYHLLVIMANFSNTSVSYLAFDFDAQMNQSNYSGTGSFRDYYLENSNGQLEVVSTVTQWVNLPKTHDYYGSESKWGEFAYDAIKAAYAAGVDFSKFDNDGDGVVDGIAIIHQGNGQESSSNEKDIWSHAWSLTSAGYRSSQLKMGAVSVDNYFTQPELNANGKEMATIGVMCHEFGHILGAYDFYDTDYEENGQHDGTGSWDLMGNGAFNGSPIGATPAHHNPWTKQQLGWVSQTLLDHYQQVLMEPVLTGHRVWRYNTSTPGEYFLLENRIKTGFDAYLPGQGMLIYHVDSTVIAERGAANDINAYEHQGLYVKVASETIDSDACPFPGSGAVVAFTDVTTPAALSWAGLPTKQSLTSILQEGDMIRFDFMDLQYGFPSFFSAKTVSESDVLLSWQQPDGAFPLLIARSVDGVFGIPGDGRVYLPGDRLEGGGVVLWAGNEGDFLMDAIGADSLIYYRLWVYRNDRYSEPMDASAYAFSNIRFLVRDLSGAVLADAGVTVANYSSSTGGDGVASLTGDFRSKGVQRFVIRKPGYVDKWGAWDTSQGDTLTVALLPQLDVPVQTTDLSVDYRDVALTWNPVVNETFAGYEPFSLTLPGWTMVDKDLAPTYAIAKVDFPNEGYTGSFMVFDGYDDAFIDSGYVFPSYAGRQFLACMAARGQANNDWLISPAITVTDSLWFSVMARSITDEYGLERMKIWVSESGTALSAFKVISGSNYLSVPAEWTRYEYDLSVYMGKTIHLAINSVSNDSYMLMLDRLVFTPERLSVNAKFKAVGKIVEQLPTRDITPASIIKNITTDVASASEAVVYQIWRDGVMVGVTSGLTANTFVDDVPGCGVYEYQIRALLGDGSQAESPVHSIASCYRVAMRFTDGIDPVGSLSVGFNGQVLQTDEDGSVLFVAVDAGMWPLVASRAGFNDYAASLDVTGNASVNLVIELNDMNERSLLYHRNDALPVVQLPDGYDSAVYCIYSLSGKCVASQSVSAYRFVPDMTGLPKGIYLMQIDMGDRAESLKIIWR